MVVRSGEFHVYFVLGKCQQQQRLSGEPFGTAGFKHRPLNKWQTIIDRRHSVKCTNKERPSDRDKYPSQRNEY